MRFSKKTRQTHPMVQHELCYSGNYCQHINSKNVEMKDNHIVETDVYNRILLFQIMKDGISISVQILISVHVRLIQR